MRHLRSLCFGDRPRTDESRIGARGLRALELAAELGAMDRTEELNFYWCGVPRMFRAPPRLRALTLSGCGRVELPDDLGACLEELHLSMCRLKAVPVAVLRAAPRLRRLDVSLNRGIDIAPLCDGSFIALEWLSVAATRLHALPAVMRLPALRTLRLTGNQDLTDVSALARADLPRLEELWANTCAFDDVPAAAGARLPALRKLSIDEQYPEMWPSLRELHATGLFARLHYLKAQSVPPFLLESLPEMRAMDVSVRDGEFGNNPACYPRLETLRMSCGLSGFPAALELPVLRELNITSVRGREGLGAALARMAPTLQVLRIGSSRLDAWPAPAGVVFPALRHVDLLLDSLGPELVQAAPNLGRLRVACPRLPELRLPRLRHLNVLDVDSLDGAEHARNLESLGVFNSRFAELPAFVGRLPRLVALELSSNRSLAISGSETLGPALRQLTVKFSPLVSDAVVRELVPAGCQVTLLGNGGVGGVAIGGGVPGMSLDAAKRALARMGATAPVAAFGAPAGVAGVGAPAGVAGFGAPAGVAGFRAGFGAPAGVAGFGAPAAVARAPAAPPMPRAEPGPDHPMPGAEPGADQS